MIGVISGNFQSHPFHLVSPSPWPLFTSTGLFCLTASGALSMHSFSISYNIFNLGLIVVVFSMSLWFRDIVSEGTFLGDHTLAVQKGLSFGVILFIVSECLFFMAIFWAFFHKVLWIETKIRGLPKALITKLFKETLKVALLVIKGVVTLLEIICINQWMGNRGSKSDSLISVKEQRVDGFFTSSSGCDKMYSKCLGNLVFIYNNYVFNLSPRTLPGLGPKGQKKCFNYFYSSKVRYSSYAMSSKLNPYYVSGFIDG
jgi:hypothetical protein